MRPLKLRKGVLGSCGFGDRQRGEALAPGVKERLPEEVTFGLVSKSSKRPVQVGRACIEKAAHSF